MLRILGGRHHGRRLESLQGKATRPLTGQVKQALFNILGDEVEGARVWDLFAGTGASGLEALSRGAERVCFVERAAPALACLQNNLEALGIPEEAALVRRSDAWKAPRVPEAFGSPSLVFLDPPYPQVEADPESCLARIGSLMECLVEDARLVFHFPKGIYEARHLSALGSLDLRSFGGAGVALLRRD